MRRHLIFTDKYLPVASMRVDKCKHIVRVVTIVPTVIVKSVVNFSNLIKWDMFSLGDEDPGVLGDDNFLCLLIENGFGGRKK